MAAPRQICDRKANAVPNLTSLVNCLRYDLQSTLPDLLFLLVSLAYYLASELRVKNAMRHTHRQANKKEDDHEEWGLPCVDATFFPPRKCS